MVARVLLGVVLSAVALSAAAFSASPLHEIAGVASATVCGNVVVHANSAIAASMHDDDSIARALARLRTTDFDTEGKSRKAAIADVARTSNEIDENVERAKTEIRRLLDFAEHPAGADRSADLDAFARELDAALHTQGKVADGLQGFLSSLEAREARANARGAAMIRSIDPDNPETFHTADRTPTALSTPAWITFNREAASATITARTEATDLAPLIAQIEADEARAAAHSEAAVGGC